MIFEKMASCLWKLELGFLTNSLISPLPNALAPNCSKLVFSPRPKMSCVIWKNFHVELHKILHQISSYFQIFGHFWQSCACLFQKIAKNLSKILFFVLFQICKFPLSLALKRPSFWRKVQISPELLDQIWKMSPFWNSLIKGFQMMLKSNSFDKVSNLANLPNTA